MSHQIGVSNTEASNADSCELAWGFGFHPDMNFQLRDMGEARVRGIIGHEALEIFYKSLQQGESYDVSKANALAHIQQLRVKELLAGEFADLKRITILNYLYDILKLYFETNRSDVENWEILEVEGFHAQEQTGEVDFYLPSRLDLVVYHKRGPFAGETSPVDHKFTYDFWNEWKLKLNAQFPLYILALRATRYAGKPEPVVRRVIVNQFRTRKLKDPQVEDLLKRDVQAYESDFIESVFANHMKKAVRLAYLKRLPWDEAVTEMKASLGSMNCQYCDFKELCLATFEGRDPKNAIDAMYKRNEYGYPPLEEIRRERG
ncbi:PD-(D/E)XK nuclease family protein [Streptomyces griseosporeus]|uniref:PD-(D/E)XK nuclease family protein n=1 Tax=Streptomyces griseosporeus TaxID=1910 RepID=UPI00167E5476|nr:PD-(D/E)XK nuclease family protein [Streptomyces griseosporeus]GHF92256.1 hypothetical protein GCM10018783_73900 [Streptomyces griseosporeus]